MPGRPWPVGPVILVGMTLRRLWPLVVLLAAACGWLALPWSWEVAGVSMAPGLPSGAIVQSGWFPALDRWRVPGRFERWVVASPDGTTAVKRVVGLPGESIAMVRGDLEVDGRTILKSPQVLAEQAVSVPAAVRRAGPAAALSFDGDVFDDVPFAPGERRLLTVVRDAGLVAVVNPADADCVTATVHTTGAGRTVSIRGLPPGRSAIVVGRLDGHLVAAAWPLVSRGDDDPFTDAPAAWGLARPWEGDESVTAFEIAVVCSSAVATAAAIERVAAWRDVHYGPSASGQERWALEAGQWFLVGDFPPGSRDSRHWGPLERRRLSCRIEGLTPGTTTSVIRSPKR